MVPGVVGGGRHVGWLVEGEWSVLEVAVVAVVVGGM